MNYANIKYYDIANGPGVRTSLFVSGCTHRCKNCFNAVAWDFHYGQPFSHATEEQLIQSCQPGYVAGLTLLGGEPMEPENQGALLPFLRRFRQRCPEKTIWCYSGYTLEQLLGREPARCRCTETDALLSLLDVLVDGEFVQELHDITLRFRGSSNQRIINLPETLASGHTALWQDEQIYASHALTPPE